MHIDDIILRDRTTFSFEFFPPRTEQSLASLRSRMDAFAALKPSFVSVTYGAGGSTRQRTHDLVVELQQEEQIDPIPHLTCIQQSQDEIEAILARYAAAGVSNILALRGDRPLDDDTYDCSQDEYDYARKLVEHVVRFNESGVHADSRGFGIGVAGFPEGHPETPNRLKQLEYLKAKVEAGAHWITTQLFFDNAAFYDWCERCDLAGINIPLIAGIMPITSLSTLNRMAELSGGTNFPAKLQRRIYRHQDDDDAVRQVGIQWATEQCNDLLDQGVAGIHFYTLNQSDATIEIFRSLGADDASALQ
ncbi:MAG: methylenetetrahydrofolate reductase [NAD(P)H] [Phycisphaerales bacterium]|nr:methylenetetrahydrofolate reductase [NAD(P)H] [Phycisphaerales bacterium]